MPARSGILGDGLIDPTKPCPLVLDMEEKLGHWSVWCDQLHCLVDALVGILPCLVVVCLQQCEFLLEQRLHGSEGGAWLEVSFKPGKVNSVDGDLPDEFVVALQ